MRPGVGARSGPRPPPARPWPLGLSLGKGRGGDSRGAFSARSPAPRGGPCCGPHGPERAAEAEEGTRPRSLSLASERGSPPGSPRSPGLVTAVPTPSCTPRVSARPSRPLDEPPRRRRHRQRSEPAPGWPCPDAPSRPAAGRSVPSRRRLRATCDPGGVPPGAPCLWEDPRPRGLWSRVVSREPGPGAGSRRRPDPSGLPPLRTWPRSWTSSSRRCFRATARRWAPPGPPSQPQPWGKSAARARAAGVPPGGSSLKLLGCQSVPASLAARSPGGRHPQAPEPSFFKYGSGSGNN